MHGVTEMWSIFVFLDPGFSWLYVHFPFIPPIILDFIAVYVLLLYYKLYERPHAKFFEMFTITPWFFYVFLFFSFPLYLFVGSCNGVSIRWTLPWSRNPLTLPSYRPNPSATSCPIMLPSSPLYIYVVAFCCTCTRIPHCFYLSSSPSYSLFSITPTYIQHHSPSIVTFFSSHFSSSFLLRYNRFE
ncbi:hypothetical protein V8B97DRAFT_471780 [Scleroderma yunnanense]